ncbi:MAG: hypothetical protein CME68_08870 [Halobacteriovoraceae bacterium]|nr:hypothetical protein [Halobacteriovoraceae bacterium]|tara:strand:+ start:384 stop:1163 length:780 start_codon:yes stop_codon:yes gene_type:complete
MIDIRITDYRQVIAFWLCFSRILAILIQLPLFDQINIPNMVKVLTSLMLTFALGSSVYPYIYRDIDIVGLDNFWILTIVYVLTGLLIGFFVKIIMSIFVGAGSVLTQQVGFSAVNYFDPSMAQSTGPFEKLITWSMIILIISSGALIPMFQGLLISFKSLNFNQLIEAKDFSNYYFYFFKSAFASILMLSSPIIFINVLIIVLLGIVTRLVPQMNVLLVSFVVNIGLGLIVFYFIIDEFFYIAFNIYTKQLGTWFNFIN